jgi:hypothetical protein
MVSMAPSTPPRSANDSNSLYTASSTRSVNAAIAWEPDHGFWMRFRPSSRLMMSWMATARRTLSSVGVVSASS